MELSLIHQPARFVRAFVARLFLGVIPHRTILGAISLHSHQRSAVERVRSLMTEFGGALLADEAGLGKTYVATALARDAVRTLIVTPAALKGMWREALSLSDTPAEITTYEALSRGQAPTGPFDLIVLDEAHHARSPATRRYKKIAALGAGARMLLLSATPIHNTRRDLAAMLGLFMGARAWMLSDSDLGRCVIRRERADLDPAPQIPDVAEPEWLYVNEDASVLESLLALPPPIPPSDGGDGGALVLFSLVKQWASSRGALSAALRGRMARAGAMTDALESGRFLSRGELAAWSFSEDAVQLAFPALLTSASPDEAAASRMLDAVRAHERGVRALHTVVCRDLAPDIERARRLREVRFRHPGEKIVAFTQYADTARAYFRLLRRDPGVGVLSAAGGGVAGGPLSRREILARFAPRASAVAPPRAIERIDLLITTDLLSEGVNLQDASVVVHLDLPWTPARLEQRVGRSRRLGALHAITTVYVMSPPAATESVLAAERRLRDKLAAASRAVGIAGSILPPINGVVRDTGQSIPHLSERLRRLLITWLDGSELGNRDERTLVAGIGAGRDGVLALVRHNGKPVLIAALDGRNATDDLGVVLEVASLATGEDITPDYAFMERALGMVERWRERTVAREISGAATAVIAPARRQAIRRIACIAARTPRHRQPLMASLAAGARRAVTAPYGVGAEKVLAELVGSPLQDEAWLRAVAAFGSVHARTAVESSRKNLRPLALLILQRKN